MEIASSPALAALTDLGQVRRTRVRTASGVARVLELDPGLGAGIPEAERPLAVGASLAPTFDFDRGPWRFAPRPDPGGFGALLLEGLIVIRIHAETRSHIELLGEGDVVSPWVGTGQELTLPTVVTASVVSRARV